MSEDKKGHGLWGDRIIIDPQAHTNHLDRPEDRAAKQRSEDIAGGRLEAARKIENVINNNYMTDKEKLDKIRAMIRALGRSFGENYEE